MSLCNELWRLQIIRGFLCNLTSNLSNCAKVRKDTYNIIKDIGHEVLVMGTRSPERLLFDKSKTLSLGISQMEGGIDPLS